jgi:hypothetical protein
VVSQVFTHAGQVMHNIDSQALKMLSWPNPRKHQHLGRSDSSTAHHNLVALCLESLSAAFCLHTDGAFSVE